MHGINTECVIKSPDAARSLINVTLSHREVAYLALEKERAPAHH